MITVFAPPILSVTHVGVKIWTIDTLRTWQSNREWGGKTRCPSEDSFSLSYHPRPLMSTALPVFKLPLPFPGPPTGFAYQGTDTGSSSSSTRDDFEAAVESRDVFHGCERCIVCGHSAILEHCFIIPGEEDYTVCATSSMISWLTQHLQWNEMKNRRYIPAHSKREPKYESRNGMLMCPSHRRAFERLYFFIRYDDTVCFI